MIKRLYATNNSIASAEAVFEQELHQGITVVNTFFIGKERELLEQLPPHSEKSASAESSALFFKEVSELYACVILNYLACLKIVKKHDKHSKRPIRTQVVELLFSQAFYLSLEHSYLYTACKAYLSDHPPVRRSAGSQKGNLFGPKKETLEVPAHFERCLVGDSPLGASIDFSSLRSTDAATTKNVELQLEMLLALAGGPSCDSSVQAASPGSSHTTTLLAQTQQAGGKRAAPASSASVRAAGVDVPGGGRRRGILSSKDEDEWDDPTPADATAEQGQPPPLQQQQQQAVRNVGAAYSMPSRIACERSPSSTPLPCMLRTVDALSTTEGMEEAGSDWAASEQATLWGFGATQSPRLARRMSGGMAASYSLSGSRNTASSLKVGGGGSGSFGAQLVVSEDMPRPSLRIEGGFHLPSSGGGNGNEKDESHAATLTDGLGGGGGGRSSSRNTSGELSLDERLLSSPTLPDPELLGLVADARGSSPSPSPPRVVSPPGRLRSPSTVSAGGAGAAARGLVMSTDATAPAGGSSSAAFVRPTVLAVGLEGKRSPALEAGGNGSVRAASTDSKQSSSAGSRGGGGNSLFNFEDEDVFEIE